MDRRAVTVAVIGVIVFLVGVVVGGYALPERVVTTTVTVTETVMRTQTLTPVEKVVVVDALGRPLVFTDVPRRVVSAMPSITEILFALGLGGNVVGVTTYCNYPPEVPKLVEAGKIQTIGGPWTIDVEKVISLQPDLILLSISPHIKLKDKLEGYGLKTLFLGGARNLHDIYEDIMLIAKIFKVEDRAKELIDEMNIKLNNITSKLLNAVKPKVLYLIGPPSWGLYSAGGDTFIGWLIETAGGDNIAKQYTGWPLLDYEFILTQDPDVIVITAMNVNPKDVYDDVVKTPLVKTKAWRDGRVYLAVGEVDDILSRPGPRVINALEVLAHIVHPEIFGEIRRADVVNLTGLLIVTPTPTTAYGVEA